MSVLSRIRTIVFGRELSASEAASEQITPVEGLSALSLDALTSVAYGPEAILLVLAGAGASALHLMLPITIAIILLLVILVTSYRQVIDAYPHGGGAYAVSRDNFGPQVSKLAGAALIVDYTLTVAVSIAAGVGQLTSAFPSTTPYTVPICLGILAVVTALNLRGLGESCAGVSTADPGVHLRVDRDHLRGPRPPARREHPEDRRLAGRHPFARGGQRPPRPQGLLRGVQRAHRRRGDRQRRAALQGAAESHVQSGPRSCSEGSSARCCSDLRCSPTSSTSNRGPTRPS